jgi:hypothetical protein
VPYYSKQEKENKMTKKYRTKQTVIDEQKEQIKDLENQIRLQEFREDSYQRRIKYEARKFSDIVAPEASITVYEDNYRPEEPLTVLASVQVFQELFDDEISIKEMDKLSEALSAFYSALSCDIRINMSINRY